MDIAIAKVSYFADIVGYLIVVISAGFSNAAAMITGTLFLSFGAGAGPAVASAAIAIIQDQKRAGHLRCILRYILAYRRLARSALDL